MAAVRLPRVWGRLHAVSVERGAGRRPVRPVAAGRRRRAVADEGGREGRRARGAVPGMQGVPSVRGGDASGWGACPGVQLTPHVDVAERVRLVDHVCAAAGVAGGRRTSRRCVAFVDAACRFTVRRRAARH